MALMYFPPMITRSAIVFSLLFGCVFAVRAEGATTESVKFSGQKAFEHLITQVGHGPRLPNSAAVDSTRAFIIDSLKQNGFKTAKQSFTGFSDLLQRDVSGVNIYGTVRPAGGSEKLKYLFSAHYDCRPHADRDPDPAMRTQPVSGANDAASGVAVLLELARIHKASQSTCSMGLLFFDLEDHGAQESNNGFCLGSRKIAADLPDDLSFEFGINIDMVADAKLELKREGISMARCPDLVNKVWRIGTGLHPLVWSDKPGPTVFDDHVPFLEMGYKYIDVIDFDYPQWHTSQDLPEYCAPESLQAVGDVLFSLMQQ